MPAIAAAVLALVACHPRHAREANTDRPPPSGSASVFTDSALYRELCTEADSGITLASRRCTPRDQSRLIRKIPE